MNEIATCLSISVRIQRDEICESSFSGGSVAGGMALRQFVLRRLVVAALVGLLVLGCSGSRTRHAARLPATIEASLPRRASATLPPPSTTSTSTSRTTTSRSMPPSPRPTAPATFPATTVSVPARRFPSTFHGGVVIHDPEVHVVVWGRGYPVASEGAVQRMVRGLAGSAFGRLLSEYYDLSGHVDNDISLSETWTDPVSSPRSIITDQIRAEARRAIAHTNWTVTPNTVILMLLSPGVHAGEGCGFHTAFVSTPPLETSPPIAVVPYPTAQTCGFGLAAPDEATFATSHELAETITDPYNHGLGGPSGWWDLGGPPLGEVADACEPANSRTLLPNGDTPIVASLFSLDKRMCITIG